MGDTATEQKWTGGRPGLGEGTAIVGSPEPPARSTHRRAPGKLEAWLGKKCHRLRELRPPGSAWSLRAAAPIALVLLAAASLTLGGCSLGGRGAKERYDNARALTSSLHQPAKGTAEERTYRNSRYRGAAFAGVQILPPTLEAAPYEDREYEAFLGDLRLALEFATAQALTSVPRLGSVNRAAPAGPGVALQCVIEALVHVTPTGHPVGRDPVFRDPRPKLIVVYRIEDAATGEPVFRYTSVGISHWEYGPWAMDDLLARAVQTAGELREALAKE